MTDLDELLALATDIAREAGAFILDRDLDLGVETKSSDTDVVTAKDRAAEVLIRARLDAARPDDGFLGEESGHGGGTSGVRWVVDPIDGTVNYLYGIPQYAVSIAVEVEGEVRVGVVYDPGKDELYQAISGAGATLNGRPIHCTSQTVLAVSLVSTGFSYSAERRGRQGAVIAQILTEIRDIRRLGSAALDLCALAAGRTDAYFERGVNPWDIAAGILIAQEAGAVVTDLNGDFPTGDFVLGAVPGVHLALRELLLPLRPDLV